MGSPVAIITTAKKMIENGKPNRKRILVAPQVPSGPVNERCIALRATWPSAAMIVKGIQSEATVNRGIPAGKKATVPGGTGAVNRNGVMTGLRLSRNSLVVPANAGTHTPRLLNLIPLVGDFRATTNTCGYGSLRSQGRHRLCN